MKSFTFGELRAELRRLLSGEVESVLTAIEPSQFHSPDLEALLFWNIVVAFVVSFSSNVALTLLPRKKHLTSADLADIEKISHERIEVEVIPDTDKVRAAVLSAIPRSVPEAKRKVLADRFTAAILDKLRRP